MEQDSKHYKEKIKEMLSVPHLSKNNFLQSVLQQLEDGKEITEKQMIVIDRIDNQ